MIILPTNIKEFHYIIHLADIQIRLTKRHDEYREVFGRLLESVKATPPETAVCVIGDIVHSKLDLSPECVQLTKEFLVGLADLRPTIVVAGNHDTNLTNKNRLDSLSPIVEAINHPQLFYLKESGLYALGDICFNNYSVFDSEDKYLKGEVIPAIYRNEYKYFVCLFHGTVDGAVSEMGFKMVNKSIPLSLFDGHDIVLLGDIHKKQDMQRYDYNTNKPYVRYCGSLIQQNHGEDLEGHGYTVWNLMQREYDHVPVPNDYGYFTVHIDKGEIKTDLTNIPKKARVRLSCFESLPTETKTALKEIKKRTELVEPPTYTREESKDQEKRTSTLGATLVRGDLTNRDHQIKLLTEFLKGKLDIKDEEVIKEIIRINDETNAEIKNDDIAKNTKWTPIRFEWDNLFSFGEDNSIDFTQMKDVVGLFATNASGKSSVFSALSWCIFDKCERDFKANNIINDQKMSCRAFIEVDIGGIRYFIERQGRMDKKGNVKVNVRFWRVVNGKEEDLTGIERSDTNNAIRAYMGAYEDFLLTSLSVQKSGKYETSFIDLGDSGRKDLLAQFMGLNIFDRLHEVANKKLNDIVSTLKVYKNENFDEELVTCTNALIQSELLLSHDTKALTMYKETGDELQQKLVEESAKYIKIDIKDKELEMTDIPAMKDLIEDFQHSITNNQNDLDTLSKKINKCNEVAEEIGKQVKELEDNNVAQVYTEWQTLTNERNKVSGLLSQRVSEAKNFKEKSKKLENYQFDPECEFCVKNADAVALEASEALKKLEEYRVIIADLMTKQTEINDRLSKIKSAEENYKTYNLLLKRRIESQELYRDYTGESEKISKRIDGFKERLKTVEEILVTLNENKDAIENNVKIDKSISEIKRLLASAKQGEKELNLSIQGLIGKKSIFESKIAELKNKVEKVKSIEKIYKAYDLYVQSTCRDGIPYEVISAAVPHIESEVNSILGQMVDFHAKFDVDGKNIIPYIVRDERHWLMSLGSGMEQFILSIAIRVALTNLSNLPKMSGIVIDEGFGVLDSEHLASIQALFHYLKSNFDFVIIISHLDVMRDFVDSRMEIKKENGFSKVNFV